MYPDPSFYFMYNFKPHILPSIIRKHLQFPAGALIVPFPETVYLNLFLLPVSTLLFQAAPIFKFCLWMRETVSIIHSFARSAAAVQYVYTFFASPLDNSRMPAVPNKTPAAKIPVFFVSIFFNISNIQPIPPSLTYAYNLCKPTSPYI